MIKIINLYGGPGSGKSTLAARIFSYLKNKKISAELITEYAKDLTWDKAFEILKDQFFISANQYHRIWRILNSYKDQDYINKDYYIITDSPVIMGSVYDIIKDEFLEDYLATLTKNPEIRIPELKSKHIESKHLFLIRSDHYEQEGRKESLLEARKKDVEIMKLLDKHNIEYKTVSRYSEIEKVIRMIT